MTRKPRSAFALCLVAFLATVTAHADEQRITPEMVVEALAEQQYDVASVTRTLLGRARIVASKGLIWREVVLDLSTGQILRDYAVEFSPEEAPAASQTTMPRGGRLIAGTKPDLMDD